MSQPYLVQENFRIGQPDGSESAHTFYADINTGVNIGPGQTVDDGEYIFLRLGFANTGDKAASASQFPVQIAYNGGTYANIGSTGAIKYATHATYLTHGNDTTDRLGGTGTFDTSNFGVIEGTYQQSSANALGIGTRQEIVIVLQVDQSQMVTNGDYYDIRVSGMNSWTNTPRFTVAGLAPPPGNTVSSAALLMTTDGYTGSHSGPYLDGNGNLYLITIDDTNEYTLKAFKSTDNGVNWAEQDSANRPTTDVTSAIAGYDVKQVGDTLHIATMNDGATCYVYYHTFQMSNHASADQWGTQDQLVYNGITDTTGEFGCNIVVQDDGDVLIMTAGNQISASYESVRYHYNIGAGWVTNNILLGTNFDNVTGSAASGLALNTNDDSIGLVAKEESGRDYTFWELANPDSAPGSGTEVFPTLTMTGFNYVATSLKYYRDGANDKYAYIAQNSSEASYLQIITNGTPGTPVSTGITVWDSLQHRVAHELLVYGTNLYYVYAKSDGDLYYKVSANGAAFGSENTLLSGITAPIISANIYVRSGNLYIGVAWENGLSGDVKFYAHDLGPVSASQNGDAALSAGATVAATGKQTISAAGALSSSGVVAATGSQNVSAGALLSGSATISATGAPVRVGDAAISASAAIGGAGTVAVPGNAGISASAVLSGAGTVIDHGDAALGASAVVSASGQLAVPGDSGLAASASIGGTGIVVDHGSADLSASADISAAGSLDVYGAAAINASAAIAGTASAGKSGDAAISAGAQVSGTGSVDAEADADLSASAAVSGAGIVVDHGEAAFTATAVVSATGSQSVLASAALSASAGVSGTGEVGGQAYGDAALSASAVISASAGMVRHGDSDLTSDATISGTAVMDVFGDGAITAGAAVAGTGDVPGAVSGDAALTASAQVSSTATLDVYGGVSVSGGGSVAATGVVTILGLANLDGSAAVTGAGETLGQTGGDASLTCSAVVAGDAKIDVYGASDLSGAGTTTASGVVTVIGESSLTAQANLTAGAVAAVLGDAGFVGSAVLAGSGALVYISPDIYEADLHTATLRSSELHIKTVRVSNLYTATLVEEDVEL